MSNNNEKVYNKVKAYLQEYPSKRSPQITVSKETKERSKNLLIKHKIGKVAIMAVAEFNSKLKNELGL